MSSISPRRVDFAPSPRRAWRDEDSQDVSPAPGSSEVVLLRCRETIERLHGDVEEERQKRQRLQDQAAANEDELATVKAQLVEESERLAAAERERRLLERQLMEMQQRQKAEKEMHEAASSQLQGLKSESVQKAQEHFAQQLRLSEAEAAAQRAEAKAAEAEAEAARSSEELRGAQHQVLEAEAGAQQLQEALEGKGQELDQALQQLAELEHRCESLGQDLEDLQADKQAIVESNQFELQELAMRQERLQGAWREREVELQRAFQERDECQNDLEQAQQEAERSRQQARRLTEENRDLTDKCQRLESELSKLRKKGEELKVEAAEKAQDLEQLQRQQRSHKSTVATLEQQVEEYRRQTRELSQELARQKAEALQVKQDLAGAAKQEEEREKILSSEKELKKRAAELTWRLEAANKEVEACRASLTSERERCKELQKLSHQEAEAHSHLQHQGLISLSELLSQAQAHARLLAQASVLNSGSPKHCCVLFFLQPPAQRRSEFETPPHLKIVQFMKGQDCQVCLTSTFFAQCTSDPSGGHRLSTLLPGSLTRVRVPGDPCKRRRGGTSVGNRPYLLIELRVGASVCSGCQVFSNRDLDTDCAERQVKAELGGISKIEFAAEDTGELKQKYEQKIAKLYQHLSEREAYERKLKGFIENEVHVLHQYNKELEHYCQWRRGAVPDPPTLLKPPIPAPDKVGRRLMRNLQNLEALK
ncbi:unnamed protein product [Effrenium voratum]|nr:unnamed protein product [Effrenium voratum]